MVNTESKLTHEADRVFRSIFKGFPGYRVASHFPSSAPADPGYDLRFDAISGKTRFRFYVQVKSRVTPQTALSVRHQLGRLPKGAIPVLYAPIISPRVAEIVRDLGFGYADRAGNCWFRSNHGPLLIERHGFPSERRPAKPAADPFSTKSSRIIRAMLSQPLEGWQVRKLAEHPDAQVSPGLVVKVKRALVEEGYAVERERRSYLRDPVGLLDAWTQRYQGRPEQVDLYFRGEPADAEAAVIRWCREHSLRCALAGFSAAWRLAPEVRYGVGAVYVEDRGLDPPLLDQLLKQLGAKRVESGPNLYLWRPFDRSVFASGQEMEPGRLPVTSALQTYLDLKRTAGRGEDAAKAVFDEYLSRDFLAAAKREEEWQRGEV